MPRIMAQLEGEITAQSALENGDVVFTVLGIKVVVRRSAAENRRIRTPTAQKKLTLDQLKSKTPLPGREAEGFIGCTAIVAGNFDTDVDPGTTRPRNILVVDYDEPGMPSPPPAAPFEYHPFLEIGPPESVLLGPLTQGPTPGPMKVNDVEVRVLGDGEDERLVPDPPANDFGIAIDLSRVPLDTPVSIDGYPDRDGRFVGFAIVVEDDSPNILLDRARPQVGVTRAQARVGGGQVDYEIRGGVYTGSAPVAPAFQTIEVVGVLDDDSQPRLIGRTTAEAVAQGFDKWRVRTTLPLSSLPVKVLARYRNAPGGAVDSGDPTPLDVRDDPDSPPPP